MKLSGAFRVELSRVLTLLEPHPYDGLRLKNYVSIQLYAMAS